MLPTRTRAGAPLFLAALATSLLASPASDPSTVVFDLAPFHPTAVLGEVMGVSSDVGVVVGARIDATFVSYDQGNWVLTGAFHLPTGSDGFTSALEGWSGQGTFELSFETDAFNGVLVPTEGLPHYTWLFEWGGGSPLELPDGSWTMIPVDGGFSQLSLTLSLAPPACTPAAVTDLAYGLAGAQGVPQLSTSGDACPDHPLAAHLATAPANGVALLAIGASPLWAPLFGGVLVPSPDIVVLLAVDEFGCATMPMPSLSALPPATTIWLQVWTVDPLAPEGLAASNGLRVDLP